MSVRSSDPLVNRLSIVATTDYIGGAELYIQRLAEGSSRLGVHLSLLGRLRTWPPELQIQDVGHGPKWSLRTVASGLLRLRGERRRLRSQLSSGEATVYNCHFKREQVGLTHILAHHGRVVWTEHGLFPTGLFGMLLRPFYRRAARSCHSIICVSEQVAQSIKQLVPPDVPVITVHSGVDLDFWFVSDADNGKEVRHTLRIPDQARVCMFAGRLDAGKRPNLAIDAALAADCYILVAGEGSLTPALEAAYGEDPKVMLLGQVGDLRPLYAAADVHLFTSTGKGEGFPTVILESSACGVPTVSCRDSGFSSDVLAAGGVSCEPTAHTMAIGISAVVDECQARRSKARSWAEGRDHNEWITAYLEALGVSYTKVDEPRNRFDD